MATLNLTYQNLYDEVSWFLGYTEIGTSPSSTNLATCQRIVESGIRRFLYPLDEKGIPHEWEFLKFPFTVTTIPGQYKYALPKDFSELKGTFHYDERSANPPQLKKNAEQITEYRVGNIITGYPEYFAVSAIRTDNTIGTLYELQFYPTPDQTYNLYGYYEADPLQMSNTGDIVLGGIRAAEAILESCLAIAEQRVDDMTTKIHTPLARELVLTMIKFDKITKTDVVDNLYKGKIKEWPKPRGFFTYPDIEHNVYPDS